ncbi:MAG TPA: hypothetical protein PKE25_02590 [Novosphingobium sp.]|nr:hypothetical protein [Novosphingobium sp.]
MSRPRFTRFAAIDWSGQAVARPKGLALAVAEEGEAAPRLIRPDGGWSRVALADWIARHADQDMLIGMDLSPAFPFLDAQAYFPGWAQSPPDAKGLWHLVERIAGADPHLGASAFVAHPEARRHFRLPGELGDRHPPGRGRLRVCEHGQRAQGLSPYSGFNLVGAAQVGKSSLTGMRVFHRLAGRVPVWPFDTLPASGAVVVEIYTALAARAAGLRPGTSKLRDGPALDAALAAFSSAPHAPLARYDDHATDALLTAAWLRRTAHEARLWTPDCLTAQIAATEGWTFGVASV